MIAHVAGVPVEEWLMPGIAGRGRVRRHARDVRDVAARVRPARKTVEKINKNATEDVRNEHTPIVSAQEWESARLALLVKEKHRLAPVTRWPPNGADARGRPWRRKYAFDGPNGTASLLDLFDGRRQLIVYRAFFEPASPAGPNMRASAARWLPTRSPTSPI